MSTFDAQINESQKQVAEAQSKISELTSRIETARQKMAAGTDISVDIENASLEDVHAHTVLMNANIAELIMGLDDVTRNPVSLKQMEFAQDNFWTSHFGGLYVFRGVEHPAVIGSKDHDALVDLPVKFVFDLTERSAIAKFLKLNDMVEPIVEARGLDAAAILHQKMDFVVASVAAQMGEDLAGAVRCDLRNLGRRYAEKLPEAWQGMAALARWAEEDGPWPRITSDHDAYFYTLRAKDHADADLVNMLLAELCPLDIRQLFICHKEAFYAAYATWPDEKRAYVVDFLDREYQVDKAGTREALFGHDAPLEEPKPVRRDMIEAVGPWGAVRRR